jgi:hypothetical protein
MIILTGYLDEFYVENVDKPTLSKYIYKQNKLVPHLA